MRASSSGRLTASQLVKAVEDAGLAERDSDPDATRAFLASLGYDPVQYVRARVVLKRPDLVVAGYVWDVPATPMRRRPYTTPRRTP
jgi:hypothetical protein